MTPNRNTHPPRLTKWLDLRVSDHDISDMKELYRAKRGLFRSRSHMVRQALREGMMLIADTPSEPQGEPLTPGDGPSETWVPVPYFPETARMELLEECRAEWGPRKGLSMARRVMQPDEVDSAHGGDIQAFTAYLLASGMTERHARRELADLSQVREPRARYTNALGQ